jgi:hypothetical protein
MPELKNNPYIDKYTGIVYTRIDVLDDTPNKTETYLDKILSMTFLKSFFSKPK